MEDQKEQEIKNIEKEKNLNENNTNEKKEEENKEKILDKKQILQDKLKKIFLEREQNKYKYNKINIPENLKYSSDNSNSSRDITKDNNNINNKEEADINNTNNIKHPSKNYVIKKPPERKNNKENKENEDDSKNKNFSLRFVNKAKNNENKNIENDEIKQNNPINNIPIEKQEKEKEKVKKKEEEKNIFSYRQLIAEKCHDIIKLENEKKDENLVINNIKQIKEDENKSQEKEKENILTPNIKIESEDKKRSKTINNNKSKEFLSTKEGTLKILQLIKAKKNEKNMLEKKLKETQNSIKEDKIDSNEKNKNTDDINIIDNNNNLLKNNINDKNNIFSNNTPNKNIILDNKAETPKENLIQNSDIKNENQIEKEKKLKENNNTNKQNSLTTKIQIYKKFKGKGKSCLMGTSSNFQTIKCKLEKEPQKNNIDNIIQPNQENPKIIIRNKINRHNTSLNITKKNYILKPKDINLNQKNNDKIKSFQSQQNLNRYKNNPKINLYEPKKGIISNNIKQFDERSLNLNIENKSPKKLYGENITYVKKSLLNNSSNKKNSSVKLNNSIGNISPLINNFNLDEINQNIISQNIEFNKYKSNSNLNSSFKLSNELGKTYYNIGNIFNIS